MLGGWFLSIFLGFLGCCLHKVASVQNHWFAFVDFFWDLSMIGIWLGFHFSNFSKLLFGKSMQIPKRYVLLQPMKTRKRLGL